MENYISVIVPYYNEEDYLHKNIFSLVNQSYSKEKYELIYINNNSNDNSKNIVTSFKNIINLDEKRKGVAFARNRGLRAASGKIIAFTDADCEVEHNWLSRINESLKDPTYFAVIGHRKFGNNKSFLNLIAEFENNKAEYTTQKLDKKYQFIYTNNFAFKKLKGHKRMKFKQMSELSGGEDVYFLHELFKRTKLKLKYDDSVKITHLEISSPYDWIRKYFNYGKVSVDIKQKVDYFEDVPNNHNYQIYKNLISRHKKYKYQLLLFLAIKSVFFKLGKVFHNNKKFR